MKNFAIKQRDGAYAVLAEHKIAFCRPPAKIAMYQIEIHQWIILQPDKLLNSETILAQLEKNILN